MLSSGQIFVSNVPSPPYKSVMHRVYVAAAVLICFPMLLIWFNKPHDINTFTPAWAFLVFPMVHDEFPSISVQ